MKIVFKLMCCLLIIFSVLFMMTAIAFAADSSPTASDASSSFLSWAFLGTMTGAIAATTLIVQFLKMPFDKVWKIHTRYIVYLIALLILLAVEYVTTGILTFDKIGLIVLNAFIVSTAAIGTYEATFKKMEVSSG